MYTQLLIVILEFLVPWIMTATGYRACQESFTLHTQTQQCYKYHTDISMGWSQARKYCQDNYNGDLLVIKDDALFVKIIEYVNTSGHPMFWIGASDTVAEYYFTWFDGRVCCQDKFWAPDEPNNDGNEDCLVIERAGANDIGLNDRSCTVETNFICETKGQCIGGFEEHFGICTNTTEYQLCELDLLPRAKCTSPVLMDLEQKLLNGSVSPTEVLSILRTNVVNSTKTLNLGDMVTIQRTMETVVNQLQNNTISQAISNDFLETASFLIDSDINGQQWERKIEKENEGVERFLFVIERFAGILSKSIPDKSIVKPNIALQIGQINSTNKNFTFPEKQFGSSVWDTKASYLLLDYNSLEDYGMSSYTSTLYRNLTNMVPNTMNNREGTFTLNSQVLSMVLLPERHKRLNTNIELTFHVSQPMEKSEHHCVFLQREKMSTASAWSSKGCHMVFSNSTVVVCRCNHLTNFALLISPYRANSDIETVSRLISLIGCILSLVGLVATVIVHGIAYFWRILPGHRCILITVLCCTLIIANVLLMTGISQTTHKIVCTTIAIILHVDLLLAFFVMLAFGVFVLFRIYFMRQQISKRMRLLLLLCAVVPPLVIVSISMGVTKLDGYGTSESCWLSKETGLLWAFTAPAGFVLLVNTIIIAPVMYRICQSMFMKSSTPLLSKSKSTAKAVCVMLPTLGITWIFGFFLMVESLQWMQIVFCILSSFQGFFIFLTQCIMQKPIRDAILKSCRRKKYISDLSCSATKQSTSNILNDTLERTNITTLDRKTGNTANTLEKTGIITKTLDETQTGRDITALRDTSEETDMNTLKIKRRVEIFEHTRTDRSQSIARKHGELEEE